MYNFRKLCGKEVVVLSAIPICIENLIAIKAFHQIETVTLHYSRSVAPLQTSGA